MIENVLFVCRADQCRSPAAATIFNRLATARHLNMRARSAGCEAWPEMPPIEEVVEALQQQGYTMGNHQSRVLTGSVLQKVDLVLCMTSRHVRLVHETWPANAAKTHLLTRYCADQEEDVADPVGGRFADYQRCVLRLEELVGLLIRRLQ